MKLTEEQIQKAVDWWGKVLENPKFDNGDDSQTGGMAMMLAYMCRGNGPTAEEIQTFKIALADTLRSGQGFWNGLHCDYHPERVLMDAADKAGIPDTAFPWKTDMYFRDDGSVHVSYGYGAPSEQI